MKVRHDFCISKRFSFVTLVNDISVLEEKEPLWYKERRKRTMRNLFILIRLVKISIPIVDRMGVMGASMHLVGE